MGDLVTQVFNGLSVGSILLLAALGLALTFGQMGVINMAHGEFMTIGAYTIFMLSSLTQSYAPTLMPYYFLLAIVVAFVLAFCAGWLAEWALIRHLYPAFPAYPPGWAVIAGLATALLTGIVFGVLPARRAARLDPVQALAKR